jgi:hypothetical protein
MGDAVKCNQSKTESHRVRRSPPFQTLSITPNSWKASPFPTDGKLYVSSSSLHTTTILLQLAYKEVEEWIINAGLAPGLIQKRNHALLVLETA